jgi:hypothetical protein
MRRLTPYFCALALVAGCGGGSTNDGPTSPNPSPPPTSTANLSGRVTDSANDSLLPVAGALLTIGDGANIGKTATTNASGEYTFTGLRRERFTVNVSANGYVTADVSVDLRSEFTRNVALTPSAPRTPFGSGQFKIGVDIAHGRYFADPQSGCYWERQRGLSGTFTDIIANRFVGYDAAQLVVDILNTDVAFRTDPKCGTWHDAPRHAAQSSITAGVWLIGAQIAPGSYEVSSRANCYWERLRHFQNQGVGGVIANSFSAAAKTQMVTIAATDAGFSSDGNCGTWTRTSAVTSASAAHDIPQSLADIEWQWTLYEQSQRRH